MALEGKSSPFHLNPGCFCKSQSVRHIVSTDISRNQQEIVCETVLSISQHEVNCARSFWFIDRTATRAKLKLRRLFCMTAPFAMVIKRLALRSRSNSSWFGIDTVGYLGSMTMEMAASDNTDSWQKDIGNSHTVSYINFFVEDPVVLLSSALFSLIHLF